MPKSDLTKNKTSTQPLSREIILAKALHIADEEGIENVSARRLAGELGKTAMALYRHFDSIEEIRFGVVALAFREVDTAPIPGERWDDTIRRTTASIREMNLNHRRAHLYLVEGAAWSPALKEHTDRVQTLHGNQGIPEHILAPTWRIIDAFLTGFILNELTEINNAPHPSSDEPEWMSTVEKAYTDQAFKDGIEIIIAGIYRLAAPDPCEWYTPQE
ncbi:MAG: TetR/AcrR family transcriptional regulator [Raoultibacter sp.]|jgi:AcrR family transcriptional regulator